MQVTKEMAFETTMKGSCYLPEFGKEISSFSQEDLMWAEDRGVVGLVGGVPAWAIAKEGGGCVWGHYGNGSDYGSGVGLYGDAYASGSGYGSGFGFVYGCDSTSGSGSGSGDSVGSSTARIENIPKTDFLDAFLENEI